MGLFDLFSNDSAERARDMANAGLQKGYDALSGLYDQGRGTLTTGYNNASEIYRGLGDQFAGMYGGGSAAYGDASGANGVEGLKRADATFKNSGLYGAYGTALNAGLQGITRARAAAGNLNSGNTDADAATFASDLAGKTYSNYLAGLQPYLGLSGQGATAAATGRASAATGLANGLGSLFANQGNAVNSTYTGMGKNDAGAEMNNYQIGKNQLDGIMSLGKLAGSLFGAF